MDNTTLLIYIDKLQKIINKYDIAQILMTFDYDRKVGIFPSNLYFLKNEKDASEISFPQDYCTLMIGELSKDNSYDFNDEQVNIINDLSPSIFEFMDTVVRNHITHETDYIDIRKNVFTFHKKLNIKIKY